ncbi:ABC transporter substrate-binding protein/permease [Lactovum miscens]|uniref:Polar amino acid transport system substrate-binding protein n=1 Tax=Lactovum miscens TaxID=190387 RepID=A0A841C3P2_9LACT|nr:ABC transporter substrate-binding protein/permease [Lactovum miscens]MBB5887443.1 polar amino acid transport system substrate-binding protein [Lactovum miscens]
MKKFILSLLTFFSIFLFGGIFSQTANAQVTVKVASDIAYAPFEYQDSNQKWAGVDVDIMHRVAAINGWKLEMSYPGFDAAVNNLQSGKVDAVIAGMSITDARRKVFDFGTPYYPSSIVIATTKLNKISDPSQLAGKTVGAKNGTISQQWLQDNQVKYGYNIKTYADGVAMLAALKTGNIAAAMDEYPVLSYAANQGEDIAVNMNPVVIGYYGFAVMKGENADLIKGFNSALAKLQADGEYDKILAKYGATPSKAKPKKSVYTIASDNAFAPFEFQATNKQYTGVDVDLLNAIAKHEGFKIKWNFVGFSAALNATQSGQADGMMAGMTITDARKQVFDFSTPYYNSNLTVAVAATDKDKIKAWSDLKGATVGAKTGTASFDYLNANAAKYGFTVKAFTDATTLYASLRDGAVQAIMDDEPVLKYAIAQGQKFVTPLPAVADGQYGFAVKKGSNPELTQMFNDGYAYLKSSGEYDKIINKYMESKQGTTNKVNAVDESTFFGIIKNNYKQLLQGIGVTIALALISFILAMILGTIFGLFIVSPIRALRIVARIYIDFIRGIPLLVFTVFLFYGVPNLIQMITGHQSPMNEFVAGIIALTLNAGAYIAEIIRGGVQAVPAGQMEASRSLGVSYVRTMRKVILPQALKITSPSLINQFIISLKDTTLVSVIGLTELLLTGQIIMARNFQQFYVYAIVGLMYLILIEALTIIARQIERRIK